MPEWIRYFGAASYLLVALLSLTVNGLLLVTFIKTYSRFKTVSFFIIAWQMLACDLMGVLAQFTVVVPMTFAGKIIYSDNLLHILGAFDSISYNAALYFAFVLTLNRFTVFVWKRLDQVLFQKPGITW
ncbi:hypothetical protein AAVH_22188 [Aphelenchoides avenae]|nr:hypothetical protein AAVH_22188 [Aphelenchus avenae]